MFAPVPVPRAVMKVPGRTPAPLMACPTANVPDPWVVSVKVVAAIDPVAATACEPVATVRVVGLEARTEAVTEAPPPVAVAGFPARSGATTLTPTFMSAVMVAGLLVVPTVCDWLTV